MNLRRIFISIILLSIASVAGLYFYYQSALKELVALPEAGHIVEIEKGESLNKVLKKLQSMSILESGLIAKIYAKEHKLANKIKKGEFHLTAPLTLPALFEILTSNKQIKYRIQFIEGSNIKQVKDVLTSQDKLTQTLADKTDLEILNLLKVDKAITHLEGLFYPDTYVYQKGDTDLSILKRAHKRLNSILNEEWAQKEKELPLKSTYEALILASIVEKETGAAHERSEIAGVFIRRLEKRMRLQTDPTVIYGLGDRYKGNITRKHLKEMTTYNTYRINGLPPTPIAMVGRDAIHAALHPDKGKSLYFVAKGDGTHQFSETINAHNNAVRKFQLRRRAGYRSTQ